MLKDPNANPAVNDDPPWLGPCRDAARKLGGDLCDPVHCDNRLVKNYVHAFCNCEEGTQYENGCKPVRYEGCCPQTNSSPVPIIEKDCFCCCGCFAGDTPVAVDKDNYKAINQFRVGDMVYVADDISLEKWSQKVIKFSSGTGEVVSSNVLIMIRFNDKDGQEDYLLASRDQLFLMPDKKLKRTSRLVPGQDELLRYDGTTAVITSLETGTYKKGVHHIATSQEPAQSVDGHLILAKGIISGDYALQISRLETTEDHLMVDNHDGLPEFGTPSYIETYKHLEATSFKAQVPGNAVTKADTQTFEPLGVKGPAYIPEHAQYFVSKEQAWDIYKNAPRQSPASDAGRELAKHLFKQFKGFYPNVVFYFDNENEMPNAFSFIEYDIPFVVVTGGLVRTDAVKYEALAYIIAHELGHLYGGSPTNDRGYSCTGQADYAAITAVMPYVWIGLSSVPVFKKGIEQIKELFSYISPEHAKGENKCMNISIDCRLRTMDAATKLLPLPECAGGPPDANLEVSGAEAWQDGSGKYVTVIFNDELDKPTAETLGNYSFNPTAKAYSAKVDDQDNSKVVIKIDIEEETGYEVIVEDVLSWDHKSLVFGKDKANFILKKST